MEFSTPDSFLSKETLQYPHKKLMLPSLMKNKVLPPEIVGSVDSCKFVVQHGKHMQLPADGT
jgi:hypothetical protein